MSYPQFIGYTKKILLKIFYKGIVPPDKRKKQGLQEVFINVFPIQDFTGNLILDFISYSLGECKDSAYGCWEKGGTYSAPLEVKINLISKKTGEIKEQDVFHGRVTAYDRKRRFRY